MCREIGRDLDWERWVKRAERAAELESLRESVKRGNPFGDERWQDWVNLPPDEAGEKMVQECIERSRPLGSERWVTAMARQLSIDTRSALAGVRSGGGRTGQQVVEIRIMVRVTFSSFLQLIDVLNVIPKYGVASRYMETKDEAFNDGLEQFVNCYDLYCTYAIARVQISYERGSRHDWSKYSMSLQIGSGLWPVVIIVQPLANSKIQEKAR